ncbi:MAG: OmpH family outer membrane protein [Bacteroidota bacterium]|nr:OmpH family outer membrane protein [Candidatus Kapabacteria bacterium]MCS7302427.1 OmpH family outer membrane protein [Candidatus Kapabacteria bacterium]MCX7937099.1 OmpH family outer membrane protein [Chlorobiota bacterium]MDW8074592.1 OmpH family outer membrane protein [Bacteroidota bacterium]MDW8270932.1 OmpH family outer membrane protein [Bacteroidota bacterium]
MQKIKQTSRTRSSIVSSVVSKLFCLGCLPLSWSTFIALFCVYSAFSQKVGYIASDAIRSRWPEMQQAEQRLQSLVDDWKREAAERLKAIEQLDAEIKKNRLVWSVEERLQKEAELSRLKDERERFLKQKFEPGGEYDQQTQLILRPVEEKLFAAVQDVAANEGYDIVLDKSTQIIPYVNPKYDLTVKVLKKLNIASEDLEKELAKAIEEDPRNKAERQKQSPPSPRKRSRGGEPTPESSTNEIPR